MLIKLSFEVYIYIYIYIYPNTTAFSINVPSTLDMQLVERKGMLPTNTVMHNAQGRFDSLHTSAAKFL